jgi:hypothetical protein
VALLAPSSGDPSIQSESFKLFSVVLSYLQSSGSTHTWFTSIKNAVDINTVALSFRQWTKNPREHNAHTSIWPPHLLRMILNTCWLITCPLWWDHDFWCSPHQTHNISLVADHCNPHFSQNRNKAMATWPSHPQSYLPQQPNMASFFLATWPGLLLSLTVQHSSDKNTPDKKISATTTVWSRKGLGLTRLWPKSLDLAIFWK